VIEKTIGDYKVRKNTLYKKNSNLATGNAYRKAGIMIIVNSTGKRLIPPSDLHIVLWITTTGSAKPVLRTLKKCFSLKSQRKKGKQAMEQNEITGQLKQPWANLKGGTYVSSEKFMRNSFPIGKW
jgi:hypothetical protein